MGFGNASFGQSCVSLVTNWIDFQGYTLVYYWHFDGLVIYADISLMQPISSTASVATVAHKWFENPYFFEDELSYKYRRDDGYSLLVEKDVNAISLHCEDKCLVTVSVPKDVYQALGNTIYKKFELLDKKGPRYKVKAPERKSLGMLCDYAFSLIYQ